MGSRYAIPQKMIVCERGGTFETSDGWVFRNSGSSTFGTAGVSQANPAWDLLNFANNNGAGAGTAESRVPFAKLGFTTADGLETAHTVYLRIRNRTNRDVGSGTVIGPATAIHDGGGGNPGNCYCAFATYLAGTPTVGIGVFTAGTFLILSSVAATTLRQGDVLALSYGFKVATSEVFLGLRLNGESVDAFIHAGGYRMGTLSALPGLVGLNTPAVPVAHVHGGTASEWWVTSGFNHYAELFDVARLFGGPRVEFLEQQRFTTDPIPSVKWYFSKELIRLTFSFKRRGGCSSASMVIQMQDWVRGVAPSPSFRSFRQPTAEDWAGDDWHGGDVVVRQRHGGQWLRIGIGNVPEAVWRGRVTSISANKADLSVKVSCLGHWQHLGNLQIGEEVSEGIRLRDAIQLLVERYALKSETVDSPIRALTIVGTGHQLDQRVSYDFKHTSVRNALDRLLRILPEGFAYGVDAGGTLYVQQQTDHYTVDLGAGQLPLLTLNTDDCLKWEPKIDFRRIENQVTVIGEPYEEDVTLGSTGVVEGRASSDKSLAMFGAFEQIKKDSNFQDDGFAAKVAHALCKRTCSPRFTARIRVLLPLDGTTAFWEVLTPFVPFVAIINPAETLARELVSNGAISTQEASVGNEVMRRYGDLTGTALEGDGDAGDFVLLDPTTTEQNLNIHWLLKLRLRFDFVHPGAAGTYAHMFGRPRGGGGNARKGWGNLVWAKDTGNLEWWFEDSGGTLRGPIATGINVPVAAPAGQIVDLTVWRDNNGDWQFYDGPTAKSASSSFQQTLAVGAFDWRWFDDNAGGDEGWHGTVDNWSLIDTKPFGLRGLDDSSTVPAFVTRTAGKPLPRNEGVGLLRMCRFNEAHHTGGPINPRSVWTFETSSGAVRTQYTASLTNVLADPSPISANNRRGFRLGDTITVGQESYSKTWGGPLILHVDEVRYVVEPSVGLVDRQMRLGQSPASFVETVASLDRQAQEQSDLLHRIEQDT